jgi:hypothetical protein
VFYTQKIAMKIVAKIEMRRCKKWFCPAGIFSQSRTDIAIFFPNFLRAIQTPVGDLMITIAPLFCVNTEGVFIYVFVPFNIY